MVVNVNGVDVDFKEVEVKLEGVEGCRCSNRWRECRENMKGPRLQEGLSMEKVD